MMSIRDFFKSGSGRPYPIDRERRRMVMVELALRDMTISDLARALGIQRPLVSKIVSGRRRSSKTERRIAEFFGLPADELFPARTSEEIALMRQAELDKRSAA
ncbi:MAG: helix-turn-helix domain-containing protein [Treponema sp.]|jgi:transcriptional regulator with XRE-family HTH domain|nr:helix-turn-helix domain-containing protein [Treponema sp.]